MSTLTMRLGSKEDSEYFFTKTFGMCMYSAGMKSFFTDEHGKIVIAQFPNKFITLWTLVVVIRVLTDWNDQALRLLGDMLLFAWAYLELRHGDSNFRKALGGIVLTYLVSKQIV